MSNLCSFFKRLRDKVLDPTELDKLEFQVVITLSEMEQLFLPIKFLYDYGTSDYSHSSKARSGGLVMYRRMHPIER